MSNVIQFRRPVREEPPETGVLSALEWRDRVQQIEELILSLDMTITSFCEMGLDIMADRGEPSRRYQKVKKSKMPKVRS